MKGTYEIGLLVAKPLTEGQLFQSSIRSLREEEPDKSYFKCKPAAVSNQPFPTNVLQTDRIHERREESSTTAEELKDGNAARAFGVWPEFNQVCVCECVIP